MLEAHLGSMYALDRTRRVVAHGPGPTGRVSRGRRLVGRALRAVATVLDRQA